MILPGLFTAIKRQIPAIVVLELTVAALAALAGACYSSDR